MSNDNKYLMVFISSNFAVFVFNKLKLTEVELISTPCIISPSCSKAIKFPEQHLKAILEEVRKNPICVKALYKIEDEEKKKYTIIKKYN